MHSCDNLCRMNCSYAAQKMRVGPSGVKFPRATYQSHIIIALIASFYEETCILIFSADVSFNKISYIELTLAIAWEITSFQGKSGIWSAALQYTILIVPIYSGIIPELCLYSFYPSSHSWSSRQKQAYRSQLQYLRSLISQGRTSREKGKHYQSLPAWYDFSDSYKGQKIHLNFCIIFPFFLR